MTRKNNKSKSLVEVKNRGLVDLDNEECLETLYRAISKLFIDSMIKRQINKSKKLNLK